MHKLESHARDLRAEAQQQDVTVRRMRLQLATARQLLRDAGVALPEALLEDGSDASAANAKAARDAAAEAALFKVGVDVCRVGLGVHLVDYRGEAQHFAALVRSPIAGQIIMTSLK